MGKRQDGENIKESSESKSKTGVAGRYYSFTSPGVPKSTLIARKNGLVNARRRKALKRGIKLMDVVQKPVRDDTAG